MGQIEYNRRVLKYLRQRLHDKLTTIAFIQWELKRAEREEEYTRAIAIREALKELE